MGCNAGMAPVSRMFMVQCPGKCQVPFYWPHGFCCVMQQRGKRSHWVALGITALRQKTKNKKQRDFRKRHFKLNISNSSSFLLFPQSCSSLRILSQYRTLLSTQLLKAKCQKYFDSSLPLLCPTILKNFKILCQLFLQSMSQFTCWHLFYY